MQGDLGADGERLPDVAGGARSCRTCRIGSPITGSGARRTGGRTGRPRPGPEPRPAAPERRRSGGCRLVAERLLERRAEGEARCPRRCGGRRPRGRRRLMVRSNPPCLPSWSACGRRTGTPVPMSVLPDRRARSRRPPRLVGGALHPPVRVARHQWSSPGLLGATVSRARSASVTLAAKAARKAAISSGVEAVTLSQPSGPR